MFSSKCKFHRYLSVRLFVMPALVLGVHVSCSSDDQSDKEPKDPEDDDVAQPIEDGFYKNPVFLPVFADPTVIKGDDGYFYAYGTEDNWSTSEVHFVPIIRSQNLIDWEYVADAFTQKPTWKNPAFIWAPDINIVNGKYYLYYSYSLWGDPNPGIGLAISDNLSGPFTDQGKLFDSNDIGVSNSIDPFYIENDGEKYLFWGSFHGIYGIKLDTNGLATTREKFQIAGDFMEGTYIHQKDGSFYLFGSVGSCCDGANSTYKVVVARSENLEGPYLSKEGYSFLNRHGSYFIAENTSGGFAGPGHNAEIITDSNGKDWLLYHAIDKTQPFLLSGATKRPLMLDKVTWENGWPKIENNRPGTEVKKGPIFK